MMIILLYGKFTLRNVQRTRKKIAFEGFKNLEDNLE